MSAELSPVTDDRRPEETLTWAAEKFGSQVVMATAFGPEGCVLIDMIARNDLPIRIVTIDTGLFFSETQALWHQLEERYGIQIEAVRPQQSIEQQAAAHGDKLWESNPDRCCELRKVAPFQAALAGMDAWITSVRRDQTQQRADSDIVEQDDRFGVVKVNPLAHWSRDRVWAYLKEHDVPVNPLHALGYPSIGCMPCTSRVQAGEDPRAGRWRGSQKTECGLHVQRGETGIVLTRRSEARG
jgi:phosphoadenylyl-sulfate reductase (thioredoxin)